VKTKKERLLSVVDLYRKVHGAREWTNAAVAVWAEMAGLVPVPGRRDTKFDQAVWDELFAAVKEEHGL